MRWKGLALWRGGKTSTSGHGRYTTVTPVRTLVSVGEWPLHTTVIIL
jgi:hypothetical protein